MKSYKSTQRNTKKKNLKKQMNKELDYDTHNDSIIRSMSVSPKIESSAYHPQRTILDSSLNV